MHRIKAILRPYKRSILDVLVLAKKITLRSIFRASRFLKILLLFTAGSADYRYKPSFPYREKFTNYLRLSFTKFHFYSYSLFASQEISLGIIGHPSEEILAWSTKVAKTLDARIYISEKSTEAIREIRLQYLEHRNSSDLLLIDAESELPNIIQILQLLMARKKLRPEFQVSAVHPAYVNPEDSSFSFNGFAYNSTKNRWQKNYSQSDEFGQNAVPNWSLRPHWHGLLISSTAIKQLSVSLFEEQTLESEIENIANALWAENRPILCYPNFSLKLGSASFVPKLPPQNKAWSDKQALEHKVIFVLPATTLSGGIRVVFEVAEGLSDRGVQTEIWSLKSPISWDHSLVKLLQFDTYSSLIHALSVENGIKVATWWETAEVVFLSSIARGLPVQFVQEFETWFYPDDPSGQAAVVASYRPEFQYMTTASYQFAELESVGIEATLIPVGYDSSLYFAQPGVQRQSGVVMAVGRSFFQKNFEMTRRAWERLQSKNYRLWLFGHEPKILSGSNVTYFDKPSNSEVNELLNKTEIFVQTSLHEGFSLPIIEAMAAGCAVITTDSHGNRDFCTDGVNCLIVEQNNDEQLANLIEQLMEDPALRERLSAEALKTAQKYQWSELLDKYYVFFNSFLGNVNE